MGTPQSPVPVKLLFGLLAASDALLAEASATLAVRFGAIDASSVPVDWNASPYYRDEMGPAIRRQFVSIAALLAPGKLAGLKQLANTLEDTWRTGVRRQVNIDPGYLSATKLVLASTKDAAHRIYLSGGIYAEATLLFSDGTFRAHAHTYPDYTAADAIAFFNRVRAVYLAQLRASAGNGQR